MKKPLFFIVGIMIAIVCLFCGCQDSESVTETRKEDFAEIAAKKIISNNLKSPSSAIWNEIAYLENNGSGQYIVYVDVEGTNSFGAYIRNKFFVVVKDINLTDKTFKYDSLFPYVECSGKNDSYNLMLIKLYNKYDETDLNDTGNSSSNNQQGGNPGTQPSTEIVCYTLTYSAGKGGTIQGNMSQTVQQGRSGSSVTAVPDEGYEFIGWDDGVDTKIRQERNVSSDGAYQAKFQLKYYSLSTQTNIEGAGDYSKHTSTQKTLGETVALN